MTSQKDPYYETLDTSTSPDAKKQTSDTFAKKVKRFFYKKQKPSENEKTPKSWRKEAIEFFRDLAIILVIVFVVRSFFILPFQISGSSMDSSYYDREFIIVDRLSYLTYTEPKRGDVVVFNTHREDKNYFIKRIIGTP